MFISFQVLAVQNYTVLGGINGAGLMNALYLQPFAVAVQMVPYRAQLNWKSYGDLLKTRGPYLEWHNKHEHLHRQNNQTDPLNSNGDTEVEVGELRQLMVVALAMAEEEKRRLNLKDEL